MSALPKSVQASIDAANKLMADQAAARSAPAPATPAVVPAAAPAPAAVALDPAAAPAAAAPASITEADWEKRYRVLQGKYNAEVPRLQAAARDQGAALQNMQQQLTATQTLLASLGQQNPAAPAAAVPVPLVNEKEIKDFGPDLYDFVRRTARQEHAALLPEIEKRIKPVADQAQKAQLSADDQAKEAYRLKQQAMYDLLDKQAPNWAALNNDPGFIAWLDQIDPYANEKRGALLNRAHTSNDGPRVAAFFNGFLKENAAVTPPATPAAPAASAPQVGLESLVAPGTPKPGVPSAQDGSGKRIWTRGEIAQFYRAKTDGHFNSDEGKKQARALEADIFAAQRENRVR